MNKEFCIYCGNKPNIKIKIFRHSPNFSGDKPEPGAESNFFFCSEEHKQLGIKYIRELDTKSLPYLAELDESMNYCEYFIREKGNEGIYKKDGFEYKVNGLWDYKSELSKGFKDFKDNYIKHFGNFARFKLHNRYKLNTN